MPEDSKKNERKQAKEQRKPRQRHQQARTEKKPEKAEEPTSSSAPKVPQKPPVYESPPPEFFKNLKRETDEILKITEEENSKYKKKEIQSNWSKYEVPIDSYEEIDEQENMGADYEKLIEAPLSLGGHFQFKHEKSWDINTGPSQYDKYFDINMEDLNVAICTIPFYERNNIEQTAFSETDILTMNNRSTRFKQKYYNDKSFSTPEVEVQDKILNSLRDNIKTENPAKTEDIVTKDIEIKTDNNIKIGPITEDEPSLTKDINLEQVDEPLNTIDNNKIIEDNKPNEQNIVTEKVEPTIETNESVVENVEHGDFIFAKPIKSLPEQSVPSNKAPEVKVEPQVKFIKPPPVETKITPAEIKVSQPSPKVADTQVEAKKNPVIESPEDLEKWLDDFLDG